MRSKNNYNLYSDWSTPIVVDLENITVDRPTFVLTEMDFVRPLPGYAIGVIAIVMLLFLGVVMLSVALCCVCVRKNYCIHIVSDHALYRYDIATSLMHLIPDVFVNMFHERKKSSCVDVN